MLTAELTRLMRPQHARLRRSCILLVALLTRGSGLAADDWPQHRHDAWHTGASRDRVPLPVTDIWYWGGAERRARSSCVVWHDRVFFIGEEGGIIQLVCLNARTGKRIWRQVDGSLGGSPVVTAAGLVVVTSSESRLTLRAFRASDGRPVAVSSFEGVIPTPIPVSDAPLDQPAGGVLPTLQPLRPERIFGRPWGYLLPVEDEIIAAQPIEWLIRWTPGGAARVARVFHLPGFAPGSPAQQAFLEGSALAEGPDGVLLASHQDDPLLPGSGRFMAVIAADGTLRWHRDFLLPLSVATVDSGLVFVVMGGEREEIVLALDWKTGQVRWQYASPIRDAEQPKFRDGYPRLGFSGLVVADGHVYGQVAEELVGLDETTGRLLWRYPLHSRYGLPRAFLVGARDHLIGQVDDILFALLPQDGKLEFQQSMLGTGSSFGTTLAGGLLLSAGEVVQALAPAERTFFLAADSPYRGDYQLPVEAKGMGSGAPDSTPPLALGRAGARMNHFVVTGPDPGACGTWPQRPETDSSVRTAQKPAAIDPTSTGTGNQPHTYIQTLADATVLPLRWDTKPRDLLRQAKARRALAPGVPMLLSLDWLDASRSTVLGVEPAAAEALPAAGSFAAVCKELAAAVRPEHFDVAPEINVYLARHPEQLHPVAEWVRTVREAIRSVSPRTQVLISVNAELLSGRYGLGPDRPFGAPELLRPVDPKTLRSLWELVDEIGISVRPRSGFVLPAELPSDYLLSVAAALGNRTGDPGAKPVVITRVTIRYDDQPQPPGLAQAGFLKHTAQACYWLDALMVACPDLVTDAEQSAFALRVRDQGRPALAVWEDVLSWKRVGRLSAEAANAAAPVNSPAGGRSAPGPAP